jgi:peptide methionine sulfoxide reductase MsrA
MREDGEDVRTPHGGRKLEEAYFSTGANAFLELELAKEVGAHGMVELGRLRRRKARALSFGSKTRRSSSLSSSSSSSSSSMGGAIMSFMPSTSSSAAGSEVVLVKWDPSNPYAPTYEELSNAFWCAHDPRLDPPVQGMNASMIYVTTDAQCETAQRMLSKKIEELGEGVLTCIESAVEFVFEPAPPSKQKVLERRASEDGSSPEHHRAGPIGTIIGTINHTFHFAVDWTKILAVDSTVWALKKFSGKASSVA